MTKKKYCPMTIEHEALEMNQALAAGCTFTLTETMPCDNCSPDGSHTWSVYDNGEFGIGQSNQTCWENDYTSSKPSGAIEIFGSCGKYPVQAGQWFHAGDGAREGYWDPNLDNIHEYPYGFSPVFGPVTSKDSVIYNQTS